MAAPRAALGLAQLGYTNVRELIGGFEYWAREGLAVISDAGRSRQSPDPLTAPAPANELTARRELKNAGSGC
jgi:3-mercaptopyruvate sulfurtransferase SseA